jgi:DNA-binding NarL/FixJ family response regulator
MKHRTIVLVENSDDFTDLVRRTLGMDDRLEICAIAVSAEAACQAVLTHQPDLVVLDHFLDSVDTGVQISPILKSAAPQTKVVLFTDYDLSSEARREPAIDAFLDKRRLRELLPLVDRLLGLEPLQRAVGQ